MVVGSPASDMKANMDSDVAQWVLSAGAAAPARLGWPGPLGAWFRSPELGPRGQRLSSALMARGASLVFEGRPQPQPPRTVAHGSGSVPR